MKVRAYLVIRADRSMRVLTRLGRGLAVDETAVLLTVNFPDGWGRVSSGPIEITAPDLPTVEVTE